MLRYIKGVSCAFALFGTLLVLFSPSQADEPIVSADEIIFQLAPKTRGLAITAAQPTSIDLPTVTFEFNSHRLTPLGERQLNEVGKALSTPEFESFRFIIAGHTDAVGSEDYNQRLSEQRARAVADYLVSKHSLDRGRLSTVGRGESQLLPGVAPDKGINRRVEIFNVGTGG